MRSVTAIVTMALVAQVHALDSMESLVDSKVDNLLDRALKVSSSPLPQGGFQKPADLDETAHAKSAQMAPLPSAAKPASGALRGQAPVQTRLPKMPQLPNLALTKDDQSRAKSAIVATVLAGLTLASPMVPAEAARSGGRIGGSAGFSRPAPRAPPRAATGAMGGGGIGGGARTNVFVNPAPPVVVSPFGGGMMGGMGYGGYGYGYGGGMSTGTYLGLSLIETLIREQQRQAYLKQQLQIQQQLGNDQAKIQQLQTELQAQNAKVDGIKAKAPPMSDDQVAQLQKQLAEQQKQIEELKANQKPEAAKQPAFALPR